MRDRDRPEHLFIFPRDTWFGATERLSHHTRQVFWPIIDPWERAAVWILDGLTAAVLALDAFMQRLLDSDKE